VGGRRKGRDFREIIGERVGGDQFLAREREEIVKKDIKLCLFDPFLYLEDLKTLKIRSNDNSWAYFWLF
jgi:hypothetical protein